jgi:16S rRNA (cytidine1402-2'-O)-methyltransferase
VYVGNLPRESRARHELLASVSRERRTLIARVTLDLLPESLAGLHDMLGERSLAIVTAGYPSTTQVWRGTFSEVPDHILDQPSVESCILVISGSKDQPTRWDRDRLQTHVQAQLEKGLGTKEISRQAAIESGWPRREIYRLAVEIARLSAGE